VDSFDLSGDGLIETQVYVPPNPFPTVKLKPLALIINGNGFNLNSYADLANYLARQGFLTVVVERFGFKGTPEQLVLDVLQFVFVQRGLPTATPIGLIGHSFGGQVAVLAAQLNASRKNKFAIQSVVGLAPTVDPSISSLTPQHTSNLLLIYGSQDQDVEGFSAEPNDAFGVYDRAGTESSTTCHAQFCAFIPAMDRIMLFIHGADHFGLINRPSADCSENCSVPINVFLARADQFCLAKGYTNAFLRWTLTGDTRYHRMLRGRYRPPSIAAIDSSAADEHDNPAGTPLRMTFQSSPKRRSMIENFEDGSWTVAGSTPGISTLFMDKGVHIGDFMNIRHWTRLLAVGWPVDNEWQMIGFDVPPTKRDLTHFSHVSLRAGQLGAGVTATHSNPPNAPQSILIGLYDGSKSSWTWSHQHAAIPQNDLRPNDGMHNVMNTVAVPLSAFSGINKTNITAVYLAFPAGSKGTLIIDSLEWFRE
jgi:pimeloyl-ACP methyl ester carboxylesterase